MIKVTTEQMADQISSVQYAMNTVKSLHANDNRFNAVAHLIRERDELASLVLKRANPAIEARRTTWLEQSLKLLQETQIGL